ncbi:hypothetical protein J2Z79_003649 [Symbiobacterium terraclitae]|uniref:Conjugal transfer protein TraX n=1 Tax=Symbiobacterium terraclitae TaxID=557451 RepID=A0ABS4JXD5_9FIRM|nr:hypothetical protein [Symbiobacterium terraclitae]
MLEWIAMLTMLVDHIGVVFCPGVLWLRIVGRIAMPLYTYGVVRGYALTRDRRRYAIRLLVIALAAQLPYQATLPPSVPFQLNIVFGFLMGIGVFAGLDAAPHWVERLARRPVPVLVRALQGALLALAFALLWIVPVSYGIYLPALLLLYRYAQRKWVLVPGHTAFNAFIFSPWDIQGLSLLSTILLILPVRYPPLRKGRWFYRAFYPLHLAVLTAVHAALASGA